MTAAAPAGGAGDAQLAKLVRDLADTEEEIAYLRSRADDLRSKIKAREDALDNQRAERLRQRNWGAGFAWDAAVDAALAKFGHPAFRPLQREAINGILQQHDVFSVLPTGAGKSLCYQLPAYLFTAAAHAHAAPVARGLTVVVSPLLALMEDQVRGLRAGGFVKAAMLCSTTDKDEKKAIMADAGQGAVQGAPGGVLYTTPEFLLQSKTLIAKLQKAFKADVLRLFVIDEAHCCSTWGHDFRPDYLKLSLLRQTFPSVPILALTATATASCVKDVCSNLSLRTPLRFKGHYNRPNIRYYVVEKETAGGADIDWIVEYIKAKNGGKKEVSGLIYTLSCKDADRLAEQLRAKGVQAVGYHSMHTPEYRQKAYNMWLREEAEVVVATIAFGMGIDKQNVRFVIHHSLPKSVEHYYQESGRAGRDGRPADSVVMYKPSDVTRLSCLIAESPNLQNNLQRLYELADHLDPQTPQCRRRPMAKYFGDHWRAEDCRGACDVCLRALSLTPADADAADYHKYANHMLAIMRTAPKDAKITPLKLVDALSSEAVASKAIRNGAKAPLSHKDKPGPGVGERIVTKLLFRKKLKEDFGFTPYGCNSYLQAVDTTPVAAPFEMGRMDGGTGVIRAVLAQQQQQRQPLERPLSTTTAAPAARLQPARVAGKAEEVRRGVVSPDSKRRRVESSGGSAAAPLGAGGNAAAGRGRGGPVRAVAPVRVQAAPPVRGAPAPAAAGGRPQDASGGAPAMGLLPMPTPAPRGRPAPRRRTVVVDDDDDSDFP